MESQISTRLALIVALATLTAGCTSQPKHEKVLDAGEAKPLHLGIEQVGAGETMRYVYCAIEKCPSITPKTPALRPTRPAAIPPAGAQSAPTPSFHRPSDSVEVDVGFDFNGTALLSGDRDRIAQAAASGNATSVLITGRSDYVGPAARQQAIAVERVAAIRKVVIGSVSRNASISEAVEIAAPLRVPAAEQARQRRGTVRFSMSSTTFPGE